MSCKARLMATNGGASWFRRLFGGTKTVPLDPARDDLVVVAFSFDDAESCSTALGRGAAAGWVDTAEAVFRHHLVLPPDQIEDATSVAAQDGYEPVMDPRPRPEIPTIGYRPSVEGGVGLTLQRVQVIDALHCSQERSRMAGLAQRRGGVVEGWDALQPGGASPSGAD
ncbi:hypothetical protein CH289_20710 [Rhodococcus sp. RS1C4]|nr:hypothetical protein CH289_20710 [Rhodococcus sp. RS1C4]